MRLVTMDGREMPVSEALAEAGAGVSPDLFYRRMKMGWTQDEAMTTPPQPRRKRSTEAQRQASIASGKKLAERYRRIIERASWKVTP